MMRRAIHTIALLGTIGLVQIAAAQPRLQIRSRSVLRLTATLDGDALNASGVLTDDMGGPLPRRRLRLAFAGTANDQLTRSQLSVDTDDAGEFSRTIRISRERAWQVTAGFAGDAHNDAVELATEAAVLKAPVLLTLIQPEPKTIELDEQSLEITVEARSAAPFHGLVGTLRDELGRVLATGLFDERGRWLATVPTRDLGEPGLGKLVIDSAEDVTHTAGQTTSDVVRVRHSHLTVACLLDRTPIEIRGALTDASGRPLAKETVSVTASGELLATLLTDASGAFATRVENGFPRGQSIRVEAVHESSTPWWLGGASHTFVTLPTPWRPTWWLLALAVAASAFALTRIDKPRSLANLLEQRKRPSQLGESVVDFAEGSRSPTSSNHIRGRVVDAMTLQPIRGALVRCSSPLGFHSAESDAEGAFALTDLPAGLHPLHVTATGYVDASIGLAIPHSGAWTGARIRLQSQRQLALSHYRRALFAWLRREDRDSQLTARDALALHNLRYGMDAKAAFGDVTDAFERAYYSAKPPSAAEVTLVSEHADKVEAAISHAQPESFDGPRGRSL